MADETTLEVQGPEGTRSVRISHPDRVVFPEPGITKLDLARYLEAVAEPFLRANGDRPISLQRFRGTIDGEQFFSKNPPRGAPAYIRDVKVVYPSARSHPQLVLDGLAGLRLERPPGVPLREPVLGQLAQPGGRRVPGGDAVLGQPGGGLLQVEGHLVGELDAARHRPGVADEPARHLLPRPQAGHPGRRQPAVHLGQAAPGSDGGHRGGQPGVLGPGGVDVAGRHDREVQLRGDAGEDIMGRRVLG